MESSAKTGERRRERERMVAEQLAARGVRDEAVLAAMREVPREAFVPEHLVEFAYEDSALSIDEGQTISQPYIVALMLEALDLHREDRVLDVGTGSGYAAAVLSRIVDEVFTIERHRPLADRAGAVFRELGYDNIHVRVGDGTLGWPGEAPFDAIAVAAAAPRVPEALGEQLAPWGRLVIPTGVTPRFQSLFRLRRDGDELQEEDLGEVRFVPLIGAAGWPDETDSARPAPRPPARSLTDLVRRSAEPFDAIEKAPLDALLERVGDARVVLLGEATQGTSEFYRMRARITRELIERRGFTIVAVEADWPDAARVDASVRGYPPAQPELEPFTRFPTWMWANREVLDFVRWLREHNRGLPEERRTGFHGLDLYSLHTSLDSVLRYLDDVDDDAARVARIRYGCLTPWAGDPASYGRAVLRGRYRECEADVVATLQDLLRRRLEYESAEGGRFFDAERNARLVANAERYYRVMYYGARASWNLRDEHMFDTLVALLAHRGDGARAVVWEHNSHVGDASATEMGARGEHNVGQLAREHFRDDAFLVGFGTHTGTVAAVHDWGEPMQVMRVRPSLEGSYERLFHESEMEAFFLALRRPKEPLLADGLLRERLERAIGVVYRPDSELASHYFHAALARQFDEYVWFDQSRAVTPLDHDPGREPGETFPFGV